MSLAEFLLARIAEDEDRAEALESATFRPRWQVGSDNRLLRGPAPEINLPARLLADCVAKRGIIELHRCVDESRTYSHEVPLYCDPCQTVDGYGCESIGDRGIWPCDTLRTLAAVYSDHPDYRDEWRP